MYRDLFQPPIVRRTRSAPHATRRSDGRHAAKAAPMASSRNLSISLKQQQYLATRECEIGSAAAAHRSRDGRYGCSRKGKKSAPQARRVREARGRRDSRVGNVRRLKSTRGPSCLVGPRHPGLASLEKVSGLRN